MTSKWVTVTELRAGSYVIVDDSPCVVKKIDISRTGKHGHAKARIEAVGLIDEKKKIVVKTGHDKMGVPIVNKRRGQVLNITNNRANIMDIESYETIDVLVPEEIKEEVSDGKQVEYWDVEGSKIIKRVLSGSG